MLKLTKADTRTHFKTKRKELIDWELKSQKVHNSLFGSLMMHRYSPIHIFLPILENGEIDTHLIINTLQKDFAPTIYISKSLENGALIHTELVSDTVLIKNKWGIDEPQNLENGLDSKAFFEKFQEEDILVLIPLLCFDKLGNRVGYGKGYYDRFLEHANPNTTKVGLSLFEPIDEILDANVHDIKMDYCVTPERIWAW
jgi:5-formyltetrahydrofolate cyclo-ligase